MSAQANTLTLDSESHLYDEIVDLRRSMLQGFVAAALLVTWGWYIFCLWMSRHFAVSSFLAMTVLILCITTLWARSRWPRLASALLCLALSGLAAALVYTWPSAMMLATGTLVIIAAASLLGQWESVAAALWAGGLALQAYRLSTGQFPDNALVIGLGWQLLLTLGAMTLALRPVGASLAWALGGWTEARRALAETQARRAEVYRALRALEEATFRIEQMNRELIVARQEAEIARAQKTRFAVTVSHELRGPLSLILGFSRLMALSPERYGEPLPDPYWADVDAIYRNSQHLAALVNDVLDLAQIQAERLPLVKDRVEVQADVVEKAVEIVRPLAERKGLYLRTEPKGALPWILADSVRLRQALLNLLTNAVRVTESGGITVSTGMLTGVIRIGVNDTGPGIPASEMPNLFREFSQVAGHGNAESQEKGSGLGLNITKQLIELHGGRIWAESRPGVGTTFHLELPLPGTEGATQGFSATESRRHDDGTLPVCLVVHRDPGVARILARHMEGFRLAAVSQEEEVELLLRDLHPRAIIASPEWQAPLDNVLSKTSFQVPIILCALPGTLDDAGRGILAYLIKPISSELLDTVMRQIRAEGDITVLIADDDPDAGRLLEMMLTAMPYQYRILRAYDGQQALDLMDLERPHVAFLDLLMPRVSGDEVIARMQASPRLRDVPVVVVSAQDPSDAPLSVGAYLSLTYRGGIELPRAGRCIHALIEAVSPHYLPERESVGLPEAAPPPGQV